MAPALSRRAFVLALACAAVVCSSPTGPGPANCPGTSGSVCYGAHHYIEYDAGDLPVIVSVPHGGALVPSNIPDRTNGTTVTDLNTIELGRAVASAFLSKTGRAVHFVICHLKRTKLDANREVNEGAAGNADAIQAWTDYHGFIDQATTAVIARDTRGIYIDLHGHGHDKQRLELGYLLTASVYDVSDAALDAGSALTVSSLRTAKPPSTASTSALLRGPTSFGGLLEPQFPSVPSPTNASPGADPYFDGGYSTDRHTTKIPGLQIESNFTGVRDTPASWAKFGDALVSAVTTFAKTHLGLNF